MVLNKSIWLQRFDFQLLHSAKCRSSMQEHTNKWTYIQLQHNIHTYIHTLYKQEKLIQKYTHVKHTSHNYTKYNHINGRRKQLWSFPQVNHSTTVQRKLDGCRFGQILLVDPEKCHVQNNISASLHTMNDIWPRKEYIASEIDVDDMKHGQTFVKRQQYALPNCAAVVIAADVLNSTLYPKLKGHRLNVTEQETISILMTSVGRERR